MSPPSEHIRPRMPPPTAGRAGAARLGRGRSVLDGANVVVTGASSGIGREFARQIAPRAAGIALLARRSSRLQTLRAELRERAPQADVTCHACDLTDLEATDAAVEEISAMHGHIDLVINNAGMASFGSFAASGWSEVRQMLRLNVEAHAYLVHRLVPPMVERGHGAILNVASGQGLVGLPGYACYAGTKHFVVGFSEGLQLELAGTGVSVTLCCPGQTRTEFFDVAGPGSDGVLPAFMEMNAVDVVRAALRGLQRRQPMVIPGARNRFALWLGTLAPRALRRFVLRLRFRRRAPSLRAGEVG